MRKVETKEGESLEVESWNLEVGKIGRLMSGFIFTQSTYSTLSTQSTK